MSGFRGWQVVCAALLLQACTQHTVRMEPIEIRPIHITVDVNMRVDRELERFFDFDEPLEPEAEPTKDGGGS